MANSQDMQSSSSSLSLAYGGASALTTLAGNAASNLLGNLNGNAALPKNGSETGRTQSVISPASITLTGTGNATQDEQSQQTADQLTTRDPKTANGSLKNTLTLQQAQELQVEIKKQQENMEAAKLVGAVLSNVVGDVAAAQRKPVDDAKSRQALDSLLANHETLNDSQLSELARLNREGVTSEGAAKTLADPEALARYSTWADGSPAKIALHGLVGLIEAKVGGGNAAAGVLGGMSQEVMAPLLSDYLKQQGIVAGSDDYKSLMQLGATLVGTAVGTLATGDVKGAATSANAAFVGVTNNFLSHQLQQRRDDLRKKEKTGKISTEELIELRTLEQADQRSDELLAKWKVDPNSLNDTQRKNLALYLDVYAAQEGATKFKQLLGPNAAVTGAFSNYGFPYAGTKEAQNAYLKAYPISLWQHLTGVGGNYSNENRDTYMTATTQLMVRGVHQAEADFTNTVLLATVRPLTVAYGAYELGYGYKAIENGEYGGKPETRAFLGFTRIAGKSPRASLPAPAQITGRPHAGQTQGDQGEPARTHA